MDEKTKKERSAEPEPAERKFEYENPMIHVLEDLPVDFPIDADWRAFGLSFFSNMCIAIFMVVSFAVFMSSLFLAAVAMLAISVGLLAISLLVAICWGTKHITSAQERIIGVLKGVASKCGITTLYKRFVTVADFSMLSMFVFILMATLYLLHGNPSENQNVTAVETLSPFVCFFVLLAVKTAKGLSASEISREELRDTFQQNDEDLNSVMMNSVKGNAEAQIYEPMRLKSYLWKNGLHDLLEERWQFSDGRKGQQEMDDILCLLDDRTHYCETEHYWDSFRLFYPHIFTEGMSHEFTRSMHAPEYTRLCCVSDHMSEDEMEESKVTRGFPKIRCTLKYNEKLPLHMAVRRHVRLMCVALVHALIPPTWMAFMHSRSFSSEVAMLRDTNHVSAQRIALLWWGDLVWAPQIWPVLMIVVSILAQTITFWEFLAHFSWINASYQKFLRRLVLFRASTELGFNTLTPMDKNIFLLAGHRTRLSCTMSESELKSEQSKLSDAFVKDLESKRRFIGRSVAERHSLVYAPLSVPNDSDRHEYVLFPYHIMPQNLRQPLGVCLWWKTRHCVKVSINALKTDLAIMLTLTLVALALMTINAGVIIILHAEFTVMTVLTLYDMIVIHVYLVPAINRFIYLGEFLQSDADLLQSFQEQLDVVTGCTVPADDKFNSYTQFRMANALMEYCKHRIKRERGATLFGLSLTPELRPKLLGLGGVGLLGTGLKSFKKFGQFVLQRASKKAIANASKGSATSLLSRKTTRHTALRGIQERILVASAAATIAVQSGPRTRLT